MFAPNFRITSVTTRALMKIEASREALVNLPIDVAMLASLRETSQLMATHYSTQIEGNRLSQGQVQEVLAGASFPGRERDEGEVRNYYTTLAKVEQIAQNTEPIAEDDIQRVKDACLKNSPRRRARSELSTSAAGSM